MATVFDQCLLDTTLTIAMFGFSEQGPPNSQWTALKLRNQIRIILSCHELFARRAEIYDGETVGIIDEDPYTHGPIILTASFREIMASAIHIIRNKPMSPIDSFALSSSTPGELLRFILDSIPSIHKMDVPTASKIYAHFDGETCDILSSDAFNVIRQKVKSILKTKSKDEESKDDESKDQIDIHDIIELTHLMLTCATLVIIRNNISIFIALSQRAHSLSTTVVNENALGNNYITLKKLPGEHFDSLVKKGRNLWEGQVDAIGLIMFSLSFFVSSGHEGDLVAVKDGASEIVQFIDDVVRANFMRKFPIVPCMLFCSLFYLCRKCVPDADSIDVKTKRIDTQIKITASHRRLKLTLESSLVANASLPGTPTRKKIVRDLASTDLLYRLLCSFVRHYGYVFKPTHII